MLIGIAVVAMGHDYNGPGASAITLGIVALIVLILAGVVARCLLADVNHDDRPAAGHPETGDSLR
jgi:hypothetical protein